MIDITVPSDQTDGLVAEIERIEELMSLRIQRGISVKPPGDVISVEVTNRSIDPLMELLDDRGIAHEASASITTSKPSSLISPSSGAGKIANDVTEATWEEMEIVIGKESNMTANVLMLMAITGIIATIGIATNALHLVIGAMVIAPGFVPIVRVALGAVGQSAAWRRGLYDTALGYAALVVGAAATTLVLDAMGTPPLGGKTSYGLPEESLISYWTSITVPALIVTAVAGAAGAVLVATNRSVLTGGVMIALALVPSATIFGMGLVTGELELAGRGMLRWIIEVGFVAFFSVLVLAWKRALVHRRKMLL